MNDKSTGHPFAAGSLKECGVSGDYFFHVLLYRRLSPAVITPESKKFPFIIMFSSENFVYLYIFEKIALLG
ncbi:hypothetical protein J9303_14335, partial [Bacillaceae bacterium Marseille-Q3522]|nr:hypothetical protein [Bacillaceae bacterium Marseille-Q3522]